MEMVDPLDIRHGNKILLFLLEKGEIKKTDLLEIMSSSDSLSRSLQDLINAGLIESETIIQGRKVILTKLTPLGRTVAEQLKKADSIIENYNNKQKTPNSNTLEKQETVSNITECPICGYKNPEHAKFCMDCGGKLE
ncbi:zinc-ribbon domain-containing protein [Ferroplasma sp.]|jgi:DNA-binding MarR family transcriptional regulator|uniref:zinc ribbon domain-containing protein n=1 Tax=Ferroplasma sp. TaxID=2591003 RepID=UPI00261D5CDF|nr:zinc-ribbon domain-containing protein [Ferroplasma sp.]